MAPWKFTPFTNDLSKLQKKKTAQDVRQAEVGEQIRNVSICVQKVTQID